MPWLRGPTVIALGPLSSCIGMTCIVSVSLRTSHTKQSSPPCVTDGRFSGHTPPCQFANACCIKLHIPTVATANYEFSLGIVVSGGVKNERASQ